MTLPLRIRRQVSIYLGVIAVLLTGCHEPKVVTWTNETSTTTTTTTTTTSTTTTSTPDCALYVEKFHKKYVAELAYVEPKNEPGVALTWCKGEGQRLLELEHDAEDDFSKWPTVYVFVMFIFGGILHIKFALDDEDFSRRPYYDEDEYDSDDSDQLRLRPARLAPEVQQSQRFRGPARDTLLKGNDLRTQSLTQILKFTVFVYWHLMPCCLLFLGFFSTSCSKGTPTWVYACYAVFALIHVAVFFTLKREWDDNKLFTTLSLLQIVLFTSLEHLDLGSDVLAVGVVGACHKEAMHLWRKAWTRTLGGLGELFVPMFVYMGLKGYCLLVFFHFTWLPQAHSMALVPGALTSLVGFAGSCGLSALCAFLHATVFSWLAHFLSSVFWVLWMGLTTFFMMGIFIHAREAKGDDGNFFQERMLLEHLAGFIVTEFIGTTEEVVEAVDAVVDVGVENGRKIVAESARIAHEIRAVLARLLLENCVQLVTQAMFFALTLHVLSPFGQLQQLASMTVSYLTTCHKMVKLFCKVCYIHEDDQKNFCSTIFMLLIGTLVLLFCPLKVFGALNCYNSQEEGHKKAATWNLSGNGCVFDDTAG